MEPALPMGAPSAAVKRPSTPCNRAVDGEGLPRAPLLHGRFPSPRPSPDGWVPAPGVSLSVPLTCPLHPLSQPPSASVLGAHSTHSPPGSSSQ